MGEAHSACVHDAPRPTVHLPADKGHAKPGTRVPGETGVWVLIFGDMLAFAVFFGVFMYSRGNEPKLFDESRTHLSVGYAVVNTILLLTSSLFVAKAVRDFRSGGGRLAPRLFAFAAVCGMGFVLNKALEYRAEIDSGATLTTNLFYAFFFTLTGVHLLHLLIGLVGLMVMWRIARRSERSSGNLLVIEVGATYWHMVDLLWIVIFPLLYLVR
jgi:nitric oxide reductase NorE protein